MSGRQVCLTDRDGMPSSSIIMTNPFVEQLFWRCGKLSYQTQTLFATVTHLLRTPYIYQGEEIA